MNKSRDITTILSSIQQYILGFFVILLPISILPFPWDSTEKGMTIAILVFTIILVTLELIKIVWSGKISFLRTTLDYVLLSLIVALVLTTVFARDLNLSLFGYNHRMGAGLLGIGSTLLVTSVSRGFLKEKKDFLKILNMFFVGSILVSILSIITLFGGNIFTLTPKLSSLGNTGYPMLGPPAVLVGYNCVSILLAYITLYFYEEDKGKDWSWFSVIAILVNISSLILFSGSKIAFNMILVFVFLWLVVLIALFFKVKSLKGKDKINNLILPVFILLSSILMQFEPVKVWVYGDKLPFSTVNLTLNFSWQIVSQVLTRSLKNGIFGLGLDSFGVAFTALKPVDFINLNFLEAFNEVLTYLSNAGFLWLIIWLVLGWYLLKELIGDIREYSDKRKPLLFFDVVLFFLYLSSFLISYTVFLRFLLFFLISLGIVLRNVIKPNEVNNVLLKIWSVDTGKNDEKVPATPIFFTVILTILAVLGLIRIGSTILSSVYILRAESYILEQRQRFSEEEPELKEEEDITDNLYRWYQSALRYDSENPLTNRKFSAVAIDKLGIIMEKYSEDMDEEALDMAVNLRRQAFEYSRNAINLSPSIYANYDNRVQVFLGVINMGYTEYTRDAISIINEAISMNSYDYENYYNKAQLYVSLQNYEQALRASTQALSIKGDYVPALLLSASINGLQGKKEIQRSYLEAAKTVLETNELQETQLYNDLTEYIDTLGEEDASEGVDLETNGQVDNEELP